MSSASSQAFLERIGIRLPIIQAPMAGISPPAMAAAVSNAGGLGSIGVGATNAAGARAMIKAVRELSSGPLNVNLFCHRPAQADAALEAAWIDRLQPLFKQYGAAATAGLSEIYRSFVEDDDMLAMLLEEKPKVVSFHFGIPAPERVRALREAGIVLLGSATSLAEARMLADGGVDAIVAQGYEAGGHRGTFDVDGHDDRLGTLALTRLIARHIDLPVIAAGGIMDGAGINAALQLGAVAAQLGTAFVGCDESLADAGYRAALFSDAAHHTTMTCAISGRMARALSNDFTRWGADVSVQDIPDYPIAYDAGKALHAAAKAAGQFGYGAQWAGQGAPLARALPVAELMKALVEEMNG
ncbi:NAD(P)H-dependent flavin oxidoreductase [Pseudomonas sp. NA-150]|uniref:NAD(P)H-dependent flavin oxidoreductase n=1 Tax=Pseudomonas sp. NA-150 TaxID=3367525 RepID=UPI0037C8A228